MNSKGEKSKSNWKNKLHELIYEADTTTGKWFDLILIILIIQRYPNYVGKC